MTVFTSPLERRLWSWALAVLVAIFAAAVFAGSLVDAVGSEVLLGIAFTVGFGLSVIAVVGMALGRRPGMEFWVAVAVAAVYLMIGVRAGVPALERTHLFEYGLLSVLLYEALAERRANGAGLRFAAPVAIVLATLAGWIDEGIQGLVPARVYDLRDVAVNGIAAVVAVVAVVVMRSLRNRRRPNADR